MESCWWGEKLSGSIDMWFCNSVTILLYILIKYISLSHIGCENVRYGGVGWCKVLICK